MEDEYTEVLMAVEHAMPSMTVKLYLSRDQALRDLNDNYVLVHQDHTDGAVSNIVDRNLICLLDLGIVLGDDDGETPGEGVLDNHSMAILLSMVTHESYHLACRWMEYLGEDDPGEEEVAYHTEAISRSLFEQLMDYLDGGPGE